VNPISTSFCIACHSALLGPAHPIAKPFFPRTLSSCIHPVPVTTKLRTGGEPLAISRPPTERRWEPIPRSLSGRFGRCHRLGHAPSSRPTTHTHTHTHTHSLAPTRWEEMFLGKLMRCGYSAGRSDTRSKGNIWGFLPAPEGVHVVSMAAHFLPTSHLHPLTGRA